MDNRTKDLKAKIDTLKNMLADAEAKLRAANKVASLFDEGTPYDLVNKIAGLRKRIDEVKGAILLLLTNDNKEVLYRRGQ
jgi:hypothetical protein